MQNNLTISTVGTVVEETRIVVTSEDCNIFISRLKDVPGLDEEERLRWVDEVKVLKLLSFLVNANVWTYTNNRQKYKCWGRN